MLSDSNSPVSHARRPGAPHGESLGVQMLQISYEALKDEQSKLRRKLTEVQSFSETQADRVRMLEWKLKQK